jgi:hypothetical protein
MVLFVVDKEAGSGGGVATAAAVLTGAGQASATGWECWQLTDSAAAAKELKTAEWEIRREAKLDFTRAG